MSRNADSVLVCDLTLPVGEANLALDEALLDMCEEGFEEPVLRFWEPATTFVVAGYANKVAAEVNVETCKERQIPILRRCTGGGTVLQCPGCLNYTVILRMDSDPLLKGIPGTNRFVMDRMRDAVQNLLSEKVEIKGHTDLATSGVKFCGNAQRRKRQCLVFHGCFLLSADIPLIEEVLLMPSKQPDYRLDRRHSDFIKNIPVTRSALVEAICLRWGVSGELANPPLKAAETLVLEKYSKSEWNAKF